MFEVEEKKLLEHEGHDVVIRVSMDKDDDHFVTLDCDTCGEYVIE